MQKRSQKESVGPVFEHLRLDVRLQTYARKSRSLREAAEIAEHLGTPKINSVFTPVRDSRPASAPHLEGQFADNDSGEDESDPDDVDYQPPPIGLPRDMRNMDEDQRQQLVNALEELEKDHHVTPTEQGVIFDRYRKFSIRIYIEKLLAGWSKTEASEFASRTIFPDSSASHRGACVRKWAEYFLSENELPCVLQGAHAKFSSLIDDEDVFQLSVTFLRALPEGERTAAVFCEWINSTLIPTITMGRRPKKPISVKTACRWLHQMNWEFGPHKKDVYVDGHERPDVVEYRKNSFIPRMIAGRMQALLFQ